MLYMLYLTALNTSKLLFFSTHDIVILEKIKKLKVVMSYGASPAIWDHKVLPATRQRWTCAALTPAR